MVEFSFADRYAAAGLAPTAEIISARQAPVDRVVAEIDEPKILDLVASYYGVASPKLLWFRDEFQKEDVTFTLVNNEREARLLSALVLGQLIAKRNDLVALAVVTGSVAGKRSPVEAGWLLKDAQTVLAALAVGERTSARLEETVTASMQQRLQEEINSVVPNDWPALLAIISKVRGEALASSKAIGAQTTKIVRELDRQTRLLREESQMLWWIFGGYSRALERSFASLAPAQAALVAAVDLATLTTVSRVGPVAAPAMLERILNLARKPKGPGSWSIAGAVDGLTRDEMQRLSIMPDAVSPYLAPVTAAIALARTIGVGAWHGRFLEIAGLEASVEFEPVELATQLYREHCLAQLL